MSVYVYIARSAIRMRGNGKSTSIFRRLLRAFSPGSNTRLAHSFERHSTEDGRALVVWVCVCANVRVKVKIIHIIDHTLYSVIERVSVVQIAFDIS